MAKTPARTSVFIFPSSSLNLEEKHFANHSGESWLPWAIQPLGKERNNPVSLTACLVVGSLQGAFPNQDFIALLFGKSAIQVVGDNSLFRSRQSRKIALLPVQIARDR
jgi:hypothetical protein